MNKPLIRTERNGDWLRFGVKVQPRSSRNQIVGEHEGDIKIKVMAPPVEGAANQALQKFLAELFKLPKKDIRIVRGETSRHKIVEIRGIEAENLLAFIPPIHKVRGEG